MRERRKFDDNGWEEDMDSEVSSDEVVVTGICESSSGRFFGN